MFHLRHDLCVRKGGDFDRWGFGHGDLLCRYCLNDKAAPSGLKIADLKRGIAVFCKIYFPEQPPDTCDDLTPVGLS